MKHYTRRLKIYSLISKFIGKTLSIFAKLILPIYSRKLDQNLRDTYYCYCISIKPFIPRVIIWALICGEDHRHFTHRGVDVVAIIRAIWKILACHKWEGASTIEQQLVRTITGYYGRSFSRKAKEILLATLVQNTIPKEDIAGLYLSVAYFGWRMNGIKKVCQRLRLNMQDLTDRQAASIIARLKYPEPKNASPLRLRQISVRSEHILKIMNNCKKISDFKLVREFTKEAIPNATFSNFRA